VETKKVEAKGKKRIREQIAADFQKWLEENPDWTHGQKFAAFDEMCDEQVAKVK
jgi:hypothetical protein